MIFLNQVKSVKKLGFLCSFVLVIAIALLYFYNMEKWAKKPDYGYALRSATGFNIIGVVTQAGQLAGLKTGDQILKINNQPVKSIKDIREKLNRQPGGKNLYIIDRDGTRVEITIENHPLGFARVFMRSGYNYVTGLCYIFIGILVFLMKPYYRASSIFYLFCITFGSLLFFLFRVGRLEPSWFGTVHIFLYTFSPAMFINLSLSFPERRNIAVKLPYLSILPYILSSILFAGIRSTTSEMLGIPKIWFLMLMAYFVPSVFIFLFSCLHAWLWSTSEIVRVRSKLILLGSALTASLPLLDTLANAIFNVYLVPDFNYYLPFLIIFPLVIAYTIIKHNLFDIDATIRRTFGYILATLGIALLYTIFIYVPSMVFGMFRLSQSPVYLVFITVLILFFFSVIRSRIQRVIDRIYYRVEYDYHDAIRKISDKMRSLMKLDEIGKTMIDTIRNTIFIDSGCVMLLDAENHCFKCLISSEDIVQKKPLEKKPGVTRKIEDSVQKLPIGLKKTKAIADHPNPAALEISIDEPFLRTIAKKKALVTCYDIQEDPYFQAERQSHEEFFKKVNATLIVPMVYKEKLTGLLSLGRKKSGKFYCQEDINLLMTLANQGAVAIENAKMVEKIIEKERLEAKIMDAFGKYVSQEVRDQILEGNIPLDGEIKDVTILFADLRNFTSLVETTPPKEIVKLINGYFTEMVESICQHNGLVLQFIGDEIEAVFGAPLPLNDHPKHAVKAALEMRERLDLMNARLEKQGYGPLRHGIGIHTGSVVAANIGSEDRKSYAMVGDTVNVASRIQGLNKELNSDILISDTTKVMLSDDIMTIKLPAMRVKGKKEPVQIYKIK
jgi:class 3 adenylate cyclase